MPGTGPETELREQTLSLEFEIRQAGLFLVILLAPWQFEARTSKVMAGPREPHCVVSFSAHWNVQCAQHDSSFASLDVDVLKLPWFAGLQRDLPDLSADMCADHDRLVMRLLDERAGAGRRVVRTSRIGAQVSHASVVAFSSAALEGSVPAGRVFVRSG